MKITCKVVSGILNMNEIVACSLKLIRCHSVIRTIDYKMIVAIFDQFPRHSIIIVHKKKSVRPVQNISILPFKARSISPLFIKPIIHHVTSCISYLHHYEILFVNYNLWLTFSQYSLTLQQSFPHSHRSHP